MNNITERNDNCHCGSLKKYKKCCLRKEEAIELNRVNYEIYGHLKEVNPETCLSLDIPACSEKCIKSHSIQNNKILTRISFEGKILGRYPATTRNDFRIEMREYGRKEFGIFTGFCSSHDTKIFSKIENQDYELNNLEQNALFAFRALSKEYHAKLGQRELAIRKYPESNIMRNMLKGANLALSELEFQRNEFRKIFLNKSFGELESFNVIFEGEYQIAVSSGLSPMYDFLGNKLNMSNDENTEFRHIYLTVFPQNGKTYTILSYLKRDREILADFVRQIITSDVNAQKKMLSNLIMLNCENFAISPCLWNKFSKKNQDVFLDKFKVNLSRIEEPDELRKDYQFTIFS